MPKAVDWARAQLRRGARLSVFGTDFQLSGSVSRMVAIRLTTTARRVSHLAVAVGGACFAILGSMVMPPDFEVLNPFLAGMFVVFVAGVSMRRKVILVDQAVARAAVRAALTEGHELGPQNWRIDGSAALELGTELLRLQRWWLPGQRNQFGYPDAARESLIVNAASPRLAPYLGPLTSPEQGTWLGTPLSAQLRGPEPTSPAESYEAGQPWPSLHQRAPEQSWPTRENPGGN